MKTKRIKRNESSHIKFYKQEVVQRDFVIRLKKKLMNLLDIEQDDTKYFVNSVEYYCLTRT